MTNTIDNRANWIRYAKERHIREGMTEGEAQAAAENDWKTYFGGTFIIEEYR